MSVHFRVEDQKIIVFGNTYPVKDQIKAIGARFNGKDKTWIISQSDHALLQVETLCRSVGGGNVGGMLVRTESEKADIASGDITGKVLEKPKVNVPPDSLSISDLMTKIKMTLTQGFPVPLWVVGEVQNVSSKPSGLFFSLAEPKNENTHVGTVTAKALLWRNKLKDLDRVRNTEVEKELLQEGMQVRVLVRVEFYQDRGNVTLQVVDVDPNFTKGALALAREKLLAELRLKGLDRKNKMLEVPRFPFRVGLITAKGSRAYSDFCDQLISQGFSGEIEFASASMQGEKVTAEVCAALEKLENKDCDLIVITRGGGSAADLRWFDEKELALKIAHCRVPVIAAIGHHDDRCVAEEISYQRQKTPTAAAEFILKVFQSTKERFQELEKTINQVLNVKMERVDKQLLQLQHGLQVQTDRRLKHLEEVLFLKSQSLLKSLQHAIHQADSLLSKFVHQISQVAQTTIMRKSHQVAQFFSQLESLPLMRIQRMESQLLKVETSIERHNPAPWLAKGWTQLIKSNGAKLTSIESVAIGDQIKTVLKDGELEFEVTSKSKKGET